MKTIILCFAFLSTSSFFNAQILNGDMETYTTTAYDTLPTLWKADSPYSTIPGKTNDAHSGSSAFVINAWYYYSPGMMVNGTLPQSDFLFGWMKAGTPISAKPTAVNGFYKYTNVVSGDSSIVKVLLKKWNSTANKIDTIGYGISKLPAAANYTNFTVAINDYSIGVQPDSIVIYFMSFDYLKGTQFGCPDSYCRYLYIDGLTLSQPTGLHKNNKENLSSFYYFNNELTVLNKENKKINISIFSIDGKCILKEHIPGIETKINVSSFTKGIYLVKVNEETYSGYKFYKE